VNQLRWACQCLPPLTRWAEVETCRDQQAFDDANVGVAYAHFGACGESAQNACPDVGANEDVGGNCLQRLWDEGPGQPVE
jgi:hypothetical protein